jgi:predicted metal-dependent hydrolase
VLTPAGPPSLTEGDGGRVGTLPFRLAWAFMPQRTPAAKPGRPRDPDAPPKPKRPRDELGRPLAWKAENRLQLEDYDSLTMEENHRLGIDHLNAGHFFPAHEAWETCWKQAKETKDAEFFKGLSQLGAGYTHLMRGNPHGAHTLLRRGAGRILRYGSPHLGIDVKGLGAIALAHADQIEAADEAGEAPPGIEFPRI